MNAFDTPRTKTLRDLIEREGPNGTGRIVGLSIEGDGVFIYTNSWEWCADCGAGTFRGDSETAAVRRFRSEVRRADRDQVASEWAHALEDVPADATLEEMGEAIRAWEDNARRQFAAAAEPAAAEPATSRTMIKPGPGGRDAAAREAGEEAAQGAAWDYVGRPATGPAAAEPAPRCLRDDPAAMAKARADRAAAYRNARTADEAEQAAESTAADFLPLCPCPDCDGTGNAPADRPASMAATFVTYSVHAPDGMPWRSRGASWRELAQNSAWRAAETRPGGPVRFPDGSMVTFMAPDGLPVEYVGGVDEAPAAAEPVTMGERLMPGCDCGAAAIGDFDGCTCY